MLIKRTLAQHLQKMLSKFPVLSLTGPRQSGKTTLLKSEFSNYKYFNLERIDQRELIKSDIIGFLKTNGTKLIFDEAQKLPELFSYIQYMVDEYNIPGMYILSGSQSFLLNDKISQSLAGRVSVNQLLPFDISELSGKHDTNILKYFVNGFYPRIYDQKIEGEEFYSSYLQTYIERDIRTLKAVGDLNTFSKFLGLCAGRIGQILNLTSLANDVGVSVNTAKSWLSLLETSYIIYLLKPYHNNFNKRLIKAPKLYFYDVGVASSLLRLTNIDQIPTHYMYGALFENLIISEFIKHYYHKGKRPEIFYWRESNGTEIDCLIESNNQNLIAFEVKAGQTFNKDFVKNLEKFPNENQNGKIEKYLIYNGDISMVKDSIKIITWKNFTDFLDQID
jgi:predicted AAA+ superfamily ATPase